MDIFSGDEPIATDNLARLGIPHNQLAARRLHGVKFIYVTIFPCASAGCAEGYLAQSAYLAHHVGRVVGVNDIYMVAPFVGVSQKLVGGKFAFQGLDRYRVNYFHVHCRRYMLKCVFLFKLYTVSLIRLASWAAFVPPLSVCHEIGFPTLISNRAPRLLKISLGR